VLNSAEFTKFLDTALMIVRLSHLHDAHNKRLNDDLAVEGDFLVDLLLFDLRPRFSCTDGSLGSNFYLVALMLEAII
jgi:hypothetical protein